MFGLHGMLGKIYVHLVSDSDLSCEKALAMADMVVQASDDNLQLCSMVPQLQAIDAMS